MMWWSGHWGWGWGGWLVMSLGMVAFWGLVIWLFLNVIRTTSRTSSRTSSGSVSPRTGTPEGILAERLARGEIDEEDYRRRLNALHASQAVGPPPRAGGQ